MTRFWSALLVLAVTCLIGLNASAEEKKDAAKKPRKSPEEVFSNLDKDNDGLLTLDEFKANKKKPEQLERAEKFFTARDKDKDGKLTLDEFKTPPKKGGRDKNKNK